MNKILLKSLFVISIFATINSFSQPIITALNYTNLGTKLLGYPILGTFTHQNAGPNLTWNYGSVSKADAVFYIVDVPSSTQSTAVLNAFPTATYFTETNGMDNTNYVTTVSEINANGQFTLGYVMGGTPNVLPAPDPFLGLPLTYQSTFGSRTYDAYGTLTTPFGTFNNVVRIAHTGATETNYLYYSFSPVIIILMGYDVNNTDQSISGAYFYNFENTTNVNELNSESFEIYPNPANNLLEIKNFTSTNSKLTISDVAGNIVYEQDGSQSIDVSSFNEGVYFVNIVDGKLNEIKKVVIKK